MGVNEFILPSDIFKCIWISYVTRNSISNPLLNLIITVSKIEDYICVWFQLLEYLPMGTEYTSAF